MRHLCPVDLGQPARGHLDHPVPSRGGPLLEAVPVGRAYASGGQPRVRDPGLHDDEEIDCVSFDGEPILEARFRLLGAVLPTFSM